jgi:hypothetical protein
VRLPRHQSIAQRIREQHAPPVSPEQEAAAAAIPNVRIQIAKPLPHQEPVIADPAPYKVLRWGRRTGKTRVDFYCAAMGHGPIGDHDGTGVLRPLHRGILSSSLDVAWICPTYRQADPLWNEEIRPRFEGKAHCLVHDTDRFVQVEGLGRLFIRTWDNAASIRGQGANLVGVIFDEAAHMDTASMWVNVVLYALMDNAGWAIFSSTTNADLDGNKEEIPPSFFNRLCAEIQQGVRDAKIWREWYATAHDNPKIQKHVLDATIEEARLTGGERAVQQEVYALLLEAGSGLAFPMWRHSVHVRDVEINEGWGCVGTLDWGSTHPGACYLLLQGPGGQLALRNEVYFNGPPRADWEQKLTARQVGQYVARKLIAFHRKYGLLPDFISADSAMWAITGVGETLAGLFQRGITDVFEGEFAAEDNPHGLRAPQLLPAPKGAGSRATRKALLTEALQWTEDKERPGQATAEGWPLLAVGTDCPHFAREIPKLPNDKLDSEKAADEQNDCYDSATYGLHTLVPEFDESTALTRANAKAREKLDNLSRREAQQFDALAQKAERAFRRGRR